MLVDQREIHLVLLYTLVVSAHLFMGCYVHARMKTRCMAN